MSRRSQILDGVSCRVYDKLTERERSVLAALDGLNREHAPAWYVGIRYVARLVWVEAGDLLVMLDTLRERKVLDFVLVIDDAHAAAIVAPWKRRPELRTIVADRARTAAGLERAA